MNKSKNKYSYPLVIDDGVRVTYDESPAHVGKLKYSVDFVTSEGTPILAAADGKVIDMKSDSDNGGPDQVLEYLGNFIEIEHENDECSEYEHLKKNGALVKIGDIVKQGQTIGYTGATGWLAHLGPHLHFMVGKYEGDMPDDFVTLEITWDHS